MYCCFLWFPLVTNLQSPILSFFKQFKAKNIFFTGRWTTLIPNSYFKYIWTFSLFVTFQNQTSNHPFAVCSSFLILKSLNLYLNCLLLRLENNLPGVIKCVDTEVLNRWKEITSHFPVIRKGSMCPLKRRPWCEWKWLFSAKSLNLPETIALKFPCEDHLWSKETYGQSQILSLSADESERAGLLAGFSFHYDCWFHFLQRCIQFAISSLEVLICANMS